jgi:hypothetical protein
MLPSIMQENFLSADEIKLIENQVLTLGDHYDDIQHNVLHSYYKPWNYYNSKFTAIKEIFEPKFRALLNFEFVVDHSHILHSVKPYPVHTDWYQVRMIKKLTPAYTIIIPLEDINSNTIVFNQCATIKAVEQWLEQECPPILPADKQVSADIWEKYLTHVDPAILKYLSLKEIFQWKQGSIHATDRKYFHCSDNYHKNMITGKKAFIFWISSVFSDNTSMY